MKLKKNDGCKLIAVIKKSEDKLIEDELLEFIETLPAELAEDERVSDRILEEILELGSDSVRSIIARRKKLSLKILNKLMGDKRLEWLIARRRDLPREIMNRLTESKYYETIIDLAQNSSVPDEILNKLTIKLNEFSYHQRKTIMDEIVLNPNLSEETALKILDMDLTEGTIKKMAYITSSIKVLNKIYDKYSDDDEDNSITSTIAWNNKSTNEELLLKMINKTKYSRVKNIIKRAASHRENISENMLKVLEEDIDPCDDRLKLNILLRKVYGNETEKR